LLTTGSVVSVGAARLRLEMVEALGTPVFGERERFTCLSPIVSAVPREDGKTYYLRPSDAAFSDAVRANLLWKHRLLHGGPPEDDRLLLEFDAAYLADPKHREGTKLVTFKGIQIKGAFAPFMLTGSAALMQTAWDCGLGEKNSIGFGMIEMGKQGSREEIVR
jgi:CRISPR-associated endoribonuclease Cas6